MSAAGNIADQAENMACWLNEVTIEEDTNKHQYNAPRMYSNNMNNNFNSEFTEICKKAQAGQKIMIIMRGAPGSGKSSLAKALLQKIQLLHNYSINDFVFSSDDFFLTKDGYEFTRTLLPDAHEWNKKRVRRKASAGWSPIIVDNTNIMIWEMQPYVQIAVQHGYLIELLEPQTAWCRSASKLASKNVHQVPKESIQRMLDRYETTNIGELLKLLKETQYSVPLPQLRLEPPLPAFPAVVSALPEKIQISRDDGFKLNINAQTWIPYEQNAVNYWAQLSESEMQVPGPSGAGTGESSMIDLLRNEKIDISAPAALPVECTNDVFQRHSLNCQNEAPSFTLLRQMYPNKQVTGLWDLYIKCNGDVDWAVDILLKEDELKTDANYGDDESFVLESDFQCGCNKSDNSHYSQASSPNISSPIDNKILAKPQRHTRSRRNCAVSSSNISKKELQLQIENCFVLGDNQYSEHTRKIRDIRNGILDQPIQSVEPSVQSSLDEDDDNVEDNALLEMELSDTVISQLRSHFQWEGEMIPMELELSPTKVFVPRQLAKQLYMVWIESVHNQIEEQRQQILRDDEQFARLLKHPKYAECSESPSNVNELLDMELAWSIYNSEQQAAKQATRQKPNDIATQLTKIKLCEKFPKIPRDTVLEIFAATDNNYVKTVEVLDCNVKSDLTGAELYEQAQRENQKLHAQEQQNQLQPFSPKLLSPRPTGISKSQSPQMHEEAKCAALRDFEETRNLAAHHAQLRSECNLKAKQAIQQGNGNVALYYSEIAHLHKRKIDIFNHRAANCIMEVHKHTQNNPDLLDLHYLHATEAVSSLDLFLDRHITVLRNCTRVYKHVFIITGRGLHSANGVSTIKKRVKTRLADRRLRWQEVNPGLLRVKVFSASKHSTNF